MFLFILGNFKSDEFYIREDHDMTEHDAPDELRSIGRECSYFTSSYPAERVHDLMGATAISCDMCQRWDNGYCDIFLRERFGESTDDDSLRR